MAESENTTPAPRYAMLPLHWYNEAFPMMTDEELEDLAESIKHHGLLHSIVLDGNGRVLDGKCRLRACEIAGVEPHFKTFEGDEEQCKDFIWDANAVRASYSSSQRAMARAIGAAMRHAEGKECYWDHRVLPEARVVAQYRGLTRSVMAGAITLSAAYERAVEHNKEAERAAAAHQRLEVLRKDDPYWAIHVDDGTLTLDQALAAAGEQRAAPVLAEHAEAIRRLGKRMVEDAIEIGRRLSECKELLAHGGWLPWLEREFRWSERAAQNFMRVHELSLKSANIADLDLPVSALYLLAAPSTLDAVRSDVLARAEAGEAFSVGDVKRLIGGARPDQPARDQFQQLRDLIAKMSRDLPDDPLVEQLRTLLQ